jgi:hypothetical protein
MTRLLLALAVLWVLSGCSGPTPSSRSTASSVGATARESPSTAGSSATPRTPPVRPDPG